MYPFKNVYFALWVAGIKITNEQIFLNIRINYKKLFKNCLKNNYGNKRKK